MGEYINRAELLKELSVIQDRPVHTAMKIIKILPTIDFVRCGECKFFSGSGYEFHCYLNGKHITFIGEVEDNGEMFGTISGTFIREFCDAAETFENEVGPIKVIEGVTRAGRKFITCELA